MLKEKGSSKNDSATKKRRISWSFPRTTLEQALRIPTVLKEKNGGNPWSPEEVRQAIGGAGGNTFFYWRFRVLSG